MNKQNDVEGAKNKHRKSLLDRLQQKIDDAPIDAKKKMSRVRNKLLNDPAPVNERFDGWNDDVEYE